MDLLPEFKDLWDRPEVCRPNWESEGRAAFRLVGALGEKRYPVEGAEQRLSCNYGLRAVLD